MDERNQAGAGATATYGNGSGTDYTVPGQTGQSPVSDMMDQAKHSMSETAGDLGEVLEEQLDKGYQKAAEMLSGVLSDLDEVAEVLDERGQHQASSLIHSATDRATRVSDYLEHTNTQELLSDTNEYARKHMWTVAAAGVAIGLLTSRFIKAATGASPSRSLSRQPQEYSREYVTGYPRGTGGGYSEPSQAGLR